MDKNATLIKEASISSCGTWRYRLTRYWGPGLMLPFVMLNPSTADAEIDDPTIRRCMSFARREGMGGIVVANLYALRATYPKSLALHPDPDGPGNLMHLETIALEAASDGVPIVCAWGAHRGDQGKYVADLLRRQGALLACLGKTKDGHPRHPLYVRADQALEAFP